MTQSEDAMLSINEVCRLVGGDKPLDKSTIYRWVRAGKFPKPKRIGPRLTRWSKADCLAALAAMKPREN